MLRLVGLIFAALLLAACNLSVPQVTPTVAPSYTPSETPLATATPSGTPSRTPTQTPDATRIAQLFPSATPTPTATDTPTLTPTATDTLTPTLTPTISPTPSATPTLTDTPLPTATDTPVPSATATDTPTLTPTATDTLTPTLTPTISPTPSATPTLTDTPLPTATDTPVPSATATDTPTLTPTATDTLTPTLTPTISPTPSATPTLTDTPLPTATDTPLPSPTPLPTIGPSDTPTATATLTETATATATITLTPTDTPTITLTFTPSPTLRPSATPTRTLSPEEIAVLLGTTAPTFTPFPTGTPTNTLTPPPTQDVTPTFITATSPAASVTPLEAVITSTPFILPTETPLPTVTPLPALIPTPFPALPPADPRTRAFVLSETGLVRGEIGLLSDTTLFERNPVNPAQYAVTDTSGLLYFTGLNGENAQRIDVSPFSQFIPRSRAENNAYVQAIAWSPDGQFLAFLVNGDQLATDGVWFFGPGQFPPVQLLVDCPQVGHPGCLIVTSPAGPDLWESRSLDWSPDMRDPALLVRTWLPSKNRAGLTVLPVTRNERARDARPPVYEYEYGSWSRDGRRILVSGSGPDGNVYIGWINRDGSFSELVLAARDIGLWVQHAVQRPDGSIVTLGAPLAEGGPAAAQRIYDGAGRALTGPIGSGPPQRVIWSPDASAVVLTVNDRVYLARIDGAVVDITAEVAGAPAINWVTGSTPALDSPQQPANSTIGLPANPAQNTQYPPGTRLRVLAPAGLFIRALPDTGAEAIASVTAGDIVIAGEAGPVQSGPYLWQQVRTESGGITGWLAAEIDGQPTIGP